MDSHFTGLLRRFVDLYEVDFEALECGLVQAEEGVRFSAEEDRYRDDKKAKRASQKRTRQEVAKRLLDVFGEQRGPGAPIDNELEELRREPAWTWESYRREKFDEVRSVLAHLLQIKREELDERLLQDGVSDANLASFMQDPRFQDAWAKYKFAELSRPDFHVFFAREFLSWLDVAVAQVGELKEVTYRKTIPSHLRSFLAEAYRCYLFGLDAACSALCGAILQEAIRVKLNAAGFSGLDEAIRDASAGDLPLLTEKAEKAAREVKKLRDLASHGNREFAESQEYRRKYVLSATREILDTLFAEEI